MTRSSAFISYSSKDEQFAKSLNAGLTNAGIDTWFAPSKIRAGDTYTAEIVKGIESSEFLILLASSSSIGNRQTGEKAAKYVLSELGCFYEQKGEKKLIPLDLDGVLMNRNADPSAALHLQNLHHHDCRLAYQRNEVSSVCDFVQSIIEQDPAGNESHANEAGSDYVKKLETFLLNGDQTSAWQYIETMPKLDHVDPAVRLLEIIVYLSCSPLRDLRLERADKVANTLATWLNNGSLTKQSAVMAFYCLGALVYEFYERNALRSPVGDFQTVKRISKSAGVPLTKTRRILAGVSRNSDAFNRLWLL